MGNYNALSIDELINLAWSSQDPEELHQLAMIDNELVLGAVFANPYTDSYSAMGNELPFKYATSLGSIARNPRSHTKSLFRVTLSEKASKETYAAALQTLMDTDRPYKLSAFLDMTRVVASIESMIGLIDSEGNGSITMDDVYNFAEQKGYDFETHMFLLACVEEGIFPEKVFSCMDGFILC